MPNRILEDGAGVHLGDSVTRRVVGLWRLGAVSVVLLLALGATGCTPRLEAMPVLLTVDQDGWVSAEYAICSNDTLVKVGTANTLVPSEPQVFQQYPGKERLEQDEIFEAELSPATLESGEFVNELTTTSSRPYGGHEAMSDAGSFFVETYDYAAEINLREVELEDGDVVLVWGGGATYRDYSVREVSRDEGMEVIEGWCDVTREEQ